MRRVRSVLTIVFFAALEMGAVAKPVTAARLRPAPDDPEAFLVDGHYLSGEELIEKMREAGDLPDLIPDGSCQFQLAGDPGATYYVRACP